MAAFCRGGEVIEMDATNHLSLSALIPLWSGKLLPTLAMHSFGMHLGWALVLAALAAYLLRAFPKGLRLAGMGIGAVTQLLPGAWSPGWWLGLAFQSPSLSLQGICLLYLMRLWQMRQMTAVASLDSAAYARWPNVLLVVAALIGWVFVLDMLALFDLQLYALGFTPYAVLASLLLVSLFELWSMRAGHDPRLQRFRELARIIVVAMLLHLLFRLPSGNAWDALMDPWLWLAAQAVLLYRALVFVRLLMRATARKVADWAVGRFGGTN